VAGVFSALIEVPLEAKTRTDFDRLVVALDMLATVDPRVSAQIDPEYRQIVLRSGPDEADVVAVIEKLRHDMNISLDVGAPQVAYRETLGRKAEIDFTHKKQSGGSGQFARINLVFEPGEPGSGCSFESKIVGGSIPKEFIPGVEKGLEASRETGVLAGFPVIAFKATLIDGNYHDVDSSVLAFEIAARAAFREGLAKAQCKLLEPIVLVEIAVPFGFEKEIVADLDTRRVERQLGVEIRRRAEVVRALVPLANMFGYANSLRLMTHGRGAHYMVFDHYSPVPRWPDDDPFRPAVGMRA
jgi:elongation factor G